VTKKTKVPKKAVVKTLPPGWLDNHQAAITAIVGKPISFLGYDQDGRAELEFTDEQGTFHTIWLQPRFVEFR
jgi:hypothetical protein